MQKKHILFSHIIIQKILDSNSYVIDATLGNGLDTLFLSSIVKKGKIFCFDIQKKAIEKSKMLLKEKVNTDIYKNIYFYNTSHLSFEEIPKKYLPISLIIYNLGYLPNGDKSITTKASTTITSVINGLKILKQGGSIFITIYPGHSEGAIEKKEIISFVKSLNNKNFSSYIFEKIEDKKAPLVLWIEKKN